MPLASDHHDSSELPVGVPVLLCNFHRKRLQSKESPPHTHSPCPAPSHSGTHMAEGIQRGEPKIIAGVRFYLSAQLPFWGLVSFCGHPSPTATFSSSGALRLLSTPHRLSRHRIHTLLHPPRPFTSAPCHSCILHKLFSLPVQFSLSPSSFASSPCPPNQPPSSKAAARLQRWPKQFASSASSCCLCLKGQRLIPTAYRSACCWSLEHCSGNR